MNPQNRMQQPTTPPPTTTTTMATLEFHPNIQWFNNNRPDHIVAQCLVINLRRVFFDKSGNG